MCIKLLAEDEYKKFEKLKDISKELLFCGAQRSIKNKAGEMAIDLLEINKSMLDDADYLKMKYILTEPAGCSLFRMTRPIEKVERRSTLQITFLVWDIFNFIVFGVLALRKTHIYVDDT